jgi:hypothetical protein
VTAGLLLASATGNALEVVLSRPTVQVLVAPGLMVAGLQVSELNAAAGAGADASRLILALIELLPLAAVS